MPELPEVETIRRSLAPHVVGRRVADVLVRERRLRRRIASGFARQLRGRRIVELERHGKYLVFLLDDGRLLLVHLGMSGSLVLMPHGSSPVRHDHVVIALEGGPLLTFNDPRRFGLMRLGHRRELVELDQVGRDAIAAPPTLDEWRTLLRGRRLPIKNLLMDQRRLGGVGNIYASEMLFLAGIRPRRRAASLRRTEIARLGDALQRVLSAAIDLGGSSINDYRDANGQPGSFQMQHAVYDRAGAACRACATPIKRLVMSGRSTFYCPRCQR